MPSINLQGCVLIDLTLFLRNPGRTGVQRYVYQLIRNWGDTPIVPVVLDNDVRLCLIDFEVFALIEFYFSCTSRVDEEWAASKLKECSRRVVRIIESGEIAGVTALFLPEPTNIWPQVWFYSKMIEDFPRQVFVLAYDFIPWHRPEYFPELDYSTSHGLNGYLRMLRRCENIAFLSAPARKTFESRVLRSSVRNSIILGGGADDLVAGKYKSATLRELEVPEFIVIGTVQRRKQHFLVLKAFEQLWESGAKATLTFVGQAGDLTQDEQKHLAAVLQDNESFAWEMDASDEDLAEWLTQARATIYVSTEEGLGLPVFESLRAKVPVVVTSDMPALDFVPAGGCIRVEATVDGVVEAVTTLLDPAAAKQIRDAIDPDMVPDWHGVASSLEAWILNDNDNRGEAGAGLLALLSRRVVRLAAKLQGVMTADDVRFIRAACRLVFGTEPTGRLIARWRTEWKAIDGDKIELVSLMLGSEDFLALSDAETRRRFLSAVVLCRHFPQMRWGQEIPEYRAAVLFERLGGLVERVKLLFDVEDDAFVDFCYRVLLHREPDDSGRASYAEFYRNVRKIESVGGARKAVIDGMMESQEFSARNSAAAANDICDAVYMLKEDAVSTGFYESIKLGKKLQMLLPELICIEDDETFCYFARRLVGGVSYREAMHATPPEMADRLDYLEQLASDSGNPQAVSEIQSWKRRLRRASAPVAVLCSA